MLTLKQQGEFLKHLEDSTCITDVYFHKGTLYVINYYDESSVEQFIDECKYTEIKYQMITSDSEYA